MIKVQAVRWTWSVVALPLLASLAVVACGDDDGGGGGNTGGASGSGATHGGDAGAGGEGTGGNSQTPDDPALVPPADLTDDPEPQPTWEGYELGDAVTATIGADGGTLSFGVGGPTIEVPAGALAEDTELSIVRLTNNAPHGAGDAWRFGPHGVEFAEAVTVTFPIGEEVEPTVDLGGLGVAFHDPEGYWRAIPDVTVDVDGKQVVAKTTHFSDWSVFQQVQLRPVVGAVLPKKVLGLWVYECVSDEVETDGITLKLLPTCKAASGFGNWQVNGIDNGDATVGETFPLLYGAAYTAPAKKPAQNPVTVSVEVPLAGGRKGLLLSQVRIVDQPCTFEEPCTWSGTSVSKVTSTSESHFATVRWVLDEKVETILGERQVFYRPEGQLWSRDYEGCQPTTQPLDLSAHSDADRDTRFVIDYTDPEDPKAFFTDTIVEIENVSSSCGGSVTWSAEIGAPDAEFSPDGSVITAQAQDDEVGYFAKFQLTRE